MKILMFSIGFVIFVLYITGYVLMITRQNRIQSGKKSRIYETHGSDTLNDFHKQESL